MDHSGIKRKTALPIVLALVLAGTWAVPASQAAADAGGRRFPKSFEVQSLDGIGNNKANPRWGAAGTIYSRVAPSAYADGISQPVTGPNGRYLSNRVFNDSGQNLLSEHGISQWGSTWGQFLDHTLGLREGRGIDDPHGEALPIPFDASDPLENFPNALPIIPFARSNPAAGTGTGAGNPREQVNLVNSYIDAWAVYGGTDGRLEWLREGPVDGDMSNNSAYLLTPDRYLPRAESRGDAATAPHMELGSHLPAGRAAVVGDVRANENLGLLGTQTLFAREHNRIVSKLPSSLTEEQKFQIARRVVIAEQQYITYNEFLPTVGVRLSPYKGYKPNVNTELTNEFATVGYRAHSMVHSEIEVETQAGRYTDAELADFEKKGFIVTNKGDKVAIDIPIHLAFEQPDLVEKLQLGPLLQGLALEPENRNDEQISNRVRTAQFRIPIDGRPECLEGPKAPPGCPTGVNDLGAVDAKRTRDHGLPGYNQMRQAYGLAPRSSFKQITGESTEKFPADPELTAGDEINDPDSLDFMKLFDARGKQLEPGSDEAENYAVTGVRRTSLAARLSKLFPTVNDVDAFTGMVSEAHVPGTEFGELQLAIWKREFQNLRDGDRFFYGNDPGLSMIRQQYGIDFRRTLGEVIAGNTDIPSSQLNRNVFLAVKARNTSR